MIHFKRLIMILLLSVGFTLTCSCAPSHQTSDLQETINTEESTASPSKEQSSDPTSKLLPEEEALGIPILNSEDYFEYINDAIMLFAKDNNLYCIRTDTRLPYLTYYFRPGIENEDGTYKAASLTKEECESLFTRFKQSLLDALSKSALEHGRGIFTRPGTRIVGFNLSNTFLDRTTHKSSEFYVADFQVDLMNYYYQDYSDNYIQLENFNSTTWDYYDTIK